LVCRESACLSVFLIKGRGSGGRVGIQTLENGCERHREEQRKPKKQRKSDQNKNGIT